MIIILSPSKTMNFEDQVTATKYSSPVFQREAQTLVQTLQQFKPEDIKKLMDVNDKIAELNYQRFQEFDLSFTPSSGRQALLAYRGDVYAGLDIANYSEQDLKFAQEQVRIISGLYGLVCALDVIQPYRLEMGNKLENPHGKDLYTFWGHKITDQIRKELQEHQNQILVNLASNEYYKAIDQDQVKQQLVTPVFKEYKDGKYKTIAIYAKKARGMMTDYIIQNKIEDPEGIKDFDYEGYHFNADLSSDREWIFTR